MTSLGEKLLIESAWLRAVRDTWPKGWWRRLGRRALVAGLALAVNYFLRDESDRAELVPATLVGLSAFFFADVLLYPMNALLAPLRQRDELREWARAELSRRRTKVSIRAAVVRGSGDTHIIDVCNPGDVAVRDIVVNLPDSECVQPLSWRRGQIVIKELRPGERGSAPFFVTKRMGGSTESLRAELTGKAGDGAAVADVTTTVIIDPLRL